MNIQKIFQTALLALALAPAARAQSESALLSELAPEQAAPSAAGEAWRDRVSTSWSLSSHAFVGSGGASGFGTFLSPSLDFRLSPTVGLSAGLFAGVQSVNNMAVLGPEGVTRHDGSITSMGGYVSGSKMLSDKLRVGGTVFYQQSSFGGASPTMNPNAFRGVGASAEVEYHFNERFSVGVRVTHQQQFGQNQFAPNESLRD